MSWVTPLAHTCLQLHHSILEQLMMCVQGPGDLHWPVTQPHKAGLAAVLGSAVLQHCLNRW